MNSKLFIKVGHTRSRRSRPPLLKHHPLGLGLCLSLQWMQSFLFLCPFCLCVSLGSYGHFAHTPPVCVAPRYSNTTNVISNTPEYRGPERARAFNRTTAFVAVAAALVLSGQPGFWFIIPVHRQLERDDGFYEKDRDATQTGGVNPK